MIGQRQSEKTSLLHVEEGEKRFSGTKRYLTPMYFLFVCTETTLFSTLCISVNSRRGGLTVKMTSLASACPLPSCSQS